MKSERDKQRDQREGKIEAMVAGGLVRVSGVMEMTGLPRSDVYEKIHAGVFKWRRTGARRIGVYRYSVLQWLRDGIVEHIV